MEAPAAGKDKLIASLLKPSAGQHRGGPLIQPIGEEPVAVAAPPSAAPSKAQEGPSLLEQMMALQAEAKKEQQKEKDATTKKSDTTFGQGLKKGFFAAAASKAPPSPPPSLTNKTAEAIPTIRPAQKPAGSGQGKVGAMSSLSKGIVIEEVQSALKEDENKMLGALKTGEWATPELTKLLMGNEMLSRGLLNPKCATALQLMQRDPAEAKRRFGQDPEVDAFLREFGKVMAAHFERLGAANDAAAAAAAGGGGGGGGGGKKAEGVEVGPLHADVLKRQQAQAQAQAAATSTRKHSTAVVSGTAAAATAPSGMPLIQETSTDEEKRVKAVLADPELRDLLMDVGMQRVLQECSDPAKFAEHMRNPETARKIKKLYENGLVGTAR